MNKMYYLSDNELSPNPHHLYNEKLIHSRHEALKLATELCTQFFGTFDTKNEFIDVILDVPGSEEGVVVSFLPLHKAYIGVKESKQYIINISLWIYNETSHQQCTEYCKHLLGLFPHAEISLRERQGVVYNTIFSKGTVREKSNKTLSSKTYQEFLENKRRSSLSNRKENV